MFVFVLCYFRAVAANSPGTNACYSEVVLSVIVGCLSVAINVL